MSTGFRLNEGDIVITNSEIEQVDGEDLTAQTIQQVLSTNKGEWLFNTDEGINFDNILGKTRTIDENAIRNEVEQGIAQVDDTLNMTEFACVYDKEQRGVKVGFTAKKPNDETVRGDVEWQ